MPNEFKWSDGLQILLLIPEIILILFSRIIFSLNSTMSCGTVIKFTPIFALTVSPTVSLNEIKAYGTSHISETNNRMLLNSC